MSFERIGKIYGLNMKEQKTGGWRSNKWVRAVIPALLLHCSIGTVYCWSIFSQDIADHGDWSWYRISFTGKNVNALVC
jgi:hypothetical protein